MLQRKLQRDPSPNIPSRGRAYTYVFPCQHEDILKIGFSRTPLARLRTLHPRYFDFFDLDRAFLVETDHVADARRLEREFSRPVAEHRAPSPLVVPRIAAGHTEWFRGAFDQVAGTARTSLSIYGYTCHAPLRHWLQDVLDRDSASLFEWSTHLFDAIQIHRPLDPEGTRSLERTLVNRLDELAAVGLPPFSLLPIEVSDWYAAQAGSVERENSTHQVFWGDFR